MDKKQSEMMACPECHGKLNFDKSSRELICEICQLAFPVRDGIPVMLIEEARRLSSQK